MSPIAVTIADAASFLVATLSRSVISFVLFFCSDAVVCVFDCEAQLLFRCPCLLLI